MRILHAHEYTQMAGRAGRRGLDTIGHVIHLVNMFEMPEMGEYMDMMNGKPQMFISKFKISYNLLLNILSTTRDIVDIRKHVEKSMMNLDIIDALTSTKETIKKHQNEMDELVGTLENTIEFQEYLDLRKQLQNVCLLYTSPSPRD